MPEIPEEAVRAADLALEAHFEGGCEALEFTCSARAAVEAAAPFIASHIADLIAANVHDRQDRGGWLSPSPCMAYVDGHDRAAAIARGTFTAGERPGGDASVRPSEAPQGDKLCRSRVPGSPESSQGLSALREGNDRLRAAIARAKAEHTRDDSNPHGPWCGTCTTAWPCRTWVALLPAEETNHG